MSAHTTGPWRVSAVGEIQDDFGVTLAYLVGPGRNSEADGRLIASAPELLSALQVARSMILTLTTSEWQGMSDTDVANNLRIDAAIAKATEA